MGGINFGFRVFRVEASGFGFRIQLEGMGLRHGVGVVLVGLSSVARGLSMTAWTCLAPLCGHSACISCTPSFIESRRGAPTRPGPSSVVFYRGNSNLNSDKTVPTTKACISDSEGGMQGR